MLQQHHERSGDRKPFLSQGNHDGVLARMTGLIQARPVFEGLQRRDQQPAEEPQPMAQQEWAQQEG